MTELESLYKLQENHNLMDKVNMQLLQLKNGHQLRKEVDKYQQLSKQLSKMEESLNSGKSQLRQSDYTLKEYELKLKDLDQDLYSGSITNEKQLNHLSEERDRIRNLLEELETEVLENMDIISDIEIEINSIKDKLADFKKEIDHNKDQRDSNIRKLEKAKIQLNDNIRSILTTIDKDLIEDYNKIRSKKGSGLAIIKDGICTGCNIMVSNYQIEDIKKHKIIKCESCNRILYIPENDIE